MGSTKDKVLSILNKMEKWFIEQDMHIYLGVLTIVVVSVLSWMLYTEHQKNAILREQLTQSITMNVEKDRKISGLQAENDNYRISQPLSSPLEPARPVTETVEKGSNKLNAKIEKVQNSLINKPAETKIVTKTETIDRPIPVDSELKAMMQQSFCASYPEDKSCRKVKK